jgi:hypothetical protein
MSQPLEITRDECLVYLASPVQYDECVVVIESKHGELLVVTDEKADGQLCVEFPVLPDVHTGWRVSLEDLRAMLSKAEQLLRQKEQ